MYLFIHLFLYLDHSLLSLLFFHSILYPPPPLYSPIYYSPVFLFRKGHASHGRQERKAYEVELGLSSSPCIKTLHGNQVWGKGSWKQGNVLGTDHASTTRSPQVHQDTELLHIHRGPRWDPSRLSNCQCIVCELLSTQVSWFYGFPCDDLWWPLCILWIYSKTID